MTAETSTGMITPDTAPLSIPGPRTSPESHEATPRADPRPHVPARVTVPRPPRARGFAVDALLALALGCGAAVMGTSTDVVLVATMLWLLMLAADGRYPQHHLGDGRASRLARVASTGTRAMVLMLAAMPWLGTDNPTAVVLLVALMATASAMHAVIGAPHRSNRIVLVGGPQEASEALEELAARNGHDVVAVCLTRVGSSPLPVPTHLGPESCSVVADQHGADAVVLLPSAQLTPSAVRRLHWDLASSGVELCLATGLLDVSPDRTRVFATGGIDLLHLSAPVLRGPRRWIKEVLERCAAAAALLVLLPALVVIGVAVRLDSPGPAIYRQTRVGRDARHFTMYKFRTMSASAHGERPALSQLNDLDGVLFKIRNDPRTTRLGASLRRWSVDEVPQLWNVVRGDMALVGPRPALPEEVARYDVDPARRLVVKPGLTGLWQVSGRSDLSWSESVRLDVKYVDNWSLRLDLEILLRTVSAVLGRRGAY